MPLTALVEIRAEDVSQVREHLESTYVRAFYELIGRFNIGVVVEVEDQETLFEETLKIRKIPGVTDTKTHLIQDGVVF